MSYPPLESFVNVPRPDSVSFTGLTEGGKPRISISFDLDDEALHPFLDALFGQTGNVLAIVRFARASKEDAK